MLKHCIESLSHKSKGTLSSHVRMAPKALFPWCWGTQLSCLLFPLFPGVPIPAVKEDRGVFSLKGNLAKRKFSSHSWECICLVYDFNLQINPLKEIFLYLMCFWSGLKKWQLKAWKGHNPHIYLVRIDS